MGLRKMKVHRKSLYTALMLNYFKKIVSAFENHYFYKRKNFKKLGMIHPGISQVKVTGMHKKFTLIELLIVVAIIGILASMLLPSLAKARAKALQAVCTSNLKQLGIATQLYLDGSDGLYMMNWKDANWADDGRSGPTDISSWHYKLAPYLDLNPTGEGQYKEVVPNALQCPVEPQPYKTNSVRTYASYGFTRRHGNATSHPGLVVRNSEGKKNVSTITNTSETVAASEKHQYGFLNVVGNSVLESQEFNIFEGADPYDVFRFPHGQDRMQILWVDSHVSFTGKMALFDTPENTDKTNAQGTMWDSER